MGAGTTREITTAELRQSIVRRAQSDATRTGSSDTILNLNSKRIDLCGATPHVFRHTYITLAASSGMDVNTLQSIAGHSDIKMTLDRYAHERENNVIAAGSLIGGVFRSM